MSEPTFKLHEEFNLGGLNFLIESSNQHEITEWIVKHRPEPYSDESETELRLFMPDGSGISGKQIDVWMHDLYCQKCKKTSSAVCI